MLIIYGHSDDCIEIESGSFRDAFAYNGKGRDYLHFPCGLVVKCEFDMEPDTAWRFKVVANPEAFAVTETDPCEDCDYRLAINCDATYAMHHATANGPDDEEAVSVVENTEWEHVSIKTKRLVYAILHRATR